MHYLATKVLKSYPMVLITLGKGMPNAIFNFSDLVSGEDCSGVRFDPGLKMIPLDLENYS